MAHQPGATIGRYEIRERLGQGGMATVYRAYHPALDRVVALKVIRADLTEQPEFLERFVREARAIARLDHPNVVQVFDFDQADGKPFLAMQYLDGTSLRERLAGLGREGKRLAQAEAARIVRQVAEGLGYAHARGVVHRDVKPANIMFSGDRAVVTDFGIAKLLSETQLTQTGVGVGTPEYMSPEQGQGLAIDHRSDIYSLGVVAYELLTGRLPFTADTPVAVVLRHVRDPLPPPSTVDPSVGQATERALQRALAKAPAERYGSAREFAEALESALRADGKLGGETAPTVVRRPTVPPAELAGWPGLRALEGRVALFVEAHRQRLRRGVFAALAAAPVIALMRLAGFEAAQIAVAAALVALMVLPGVPWSRFAFALSALIAGVCLYLLAPSLLAVWASVVALLPLVMLIARPDRAERAVTGFALPVAAPLGLAPALVLPALLIHGRVGGAVAVASGAVWTALAAVAVGRQTLGPFAQSALPAAGGAIFDAGRAIESRAKLLEALRAGGGGDRLLSAIGDLVDEKLLAAQFEALVSGLTSVPAISTIVAWVVAAVSVAAVAHGVRAPLETFLTKRGRSAFAAELAATAFGAAAGAAALYAIFAGWPAFEAGRPEEGALLVSALLGVLLAVVVAVACGRPTPVAEKPKEAEERKEEEQEEKAEEKKTSGRQAAKPKAFLASSRWQWVLAVFLALAFLALRRLEESGSERSSPSPTGGASSAFDASYDYHYEFRRPGGATQRLDIPSGFVVRGGRVSSNPEGYFQGTVTSSGTVAMNGPCPQTPVASATWTGSLRGDGTGSGTYECGSAGNGTWSVRQR